MSDILNKIQEKVNKKEAVVLENTSFENYVDNLKQKLEDAENSLAGADGEIPEHVVIIFDKETNVIMTLQGKSSLSEGWGEVK